MTLSKLLKSSPQLVEVRNDFNATRKFPPILLKLKENLTQVNHVFIITAQSWTARISGCEISTDAIGRLK